MKNLIFVGLTTLAVAQPTSMDQVNKIEMPKEAADQMDKGRNVVNLDYDEMWNNVPKNKIKAKI